MIQVFAVNLAWLVATNQFNLDSCNQNVQTTKKKKYISFFLVNIF